MPELSQVRYYPCAITSHDARCIEVVATLRAALEMGPRYTRERRSSSAARMLARGENAWRPEHPRARRVSTALRAYAALTTSAARGAVRDLAPMTRR